MILLLVVNHITILKYLCINIYVMVLNIAKFAIKMFFKIMNRKLHIMEYSAVTRMMQVHVY